MYDLKYIKEYKSNKAFRESFFELTNNIFGINFQDWYEAGYWTDQYTPYSYVDDDKIVANVSVNKLDLVIEGKIKRAIQIGTVMTHPDYRHRGLAKRLMDLVLKEYEDIYDYMYLFANDTVLNFYPKFGFKQIEEYEYYTTFYRCKNKGPAQKLNGKNKLDLALIYQMVCKRQPVSEKFGVIHNVGIFMFYCMNVFHNDMYYVEQEDAIIIYKKINNQVIIYDIVSERKVNINIILASIIGTSSTVIFQYTPDYDCLVYKKHLFQGSESFFVKINGNSSFPVGVKHPITSQA